MSEPHLLIHVFEDTADNLLMSYEIGWNTVFIHNGKPMERLPEHIHRQDATPTDKLIELLAFAQDPAPNTFGL